MQENCSYLTPLLALIIRFLYYCTPASENLQCNSVFLPYLVDTGDLGHQLEEALGATERLDRQMIEHLIRQSQMNESKASINSLPRDNSTVQVCQPLFPLFCIDQAPNGKTAK